VPPATGHDRRRTRRDQSHGTSDKVVLLRKRSGILSLVRDGLVIAVAGVVLFAAFEVGIHLFRPQTIRTEYVANGPLAVEDSTLGHLYRPNVHARATGPEYSVDYRTNGEGLRDKSSHPTPKPAGSTRVLLLGDSFTFGDGNPYDAIWPVVFEREVRAKGYDVEVIKAGVAGYDTRSEVLYLERIYARYQPDIVVIAFLPNDLFTNSPIREGEPFRNENVVQFRRDKRNKLHSVILAKRLLMASDRLYMKLYLMTVRREFFSVPAGERVERQMDITRELLLRARQFCREHGARFAVLSVPQQFQVIMASRVDVPRGIDVEAIDRELAAFAAGNGFAWIPTLGALSGSYRMQEEPLYFRFDGHLNEKGNHVVGDHFAAEFVRVFGNRL
jgi:hypothetical protein